MTPYFWYDTRPLTGWRRVVAAIGAGATLVGVACLTVAAVSLLLGALFGG